MKNKKWSDSEILKILKEYESGISAKELEKKYETPEAANSAREKAKRIIIARKKRAKARNIDITLQTYDTILNTKDREAVEKISTALKAEAKAVIE